MSSVALRERVPLFAAAIAAIARGCAPLNAWWAGRSIGDRRILAGCAMLAGVLLVWAVLWAPAADGIATLKRSLPELRDQQRTVQALAAEVSGLRARGVHPPAAGRAGAAPATLASLATVSPSLRRSALQEALTRAALGAATIDAGDSPARWRLRWARVDYGAWLVWAASLEHTAGVRVGQVNVEVVPANADNASGQVMLDMEIEWPAS